MSSQPNSRLLILLFPLFGLFIIIAAFLLVGKSSPAPLYQQASLVNFNVKAASNRNAKQLVVTQPLANGIDLAFDRAGKISKVYVNVGDRVVKGQPLAELDSNDLTLRLSDAQANVDIQKAKLSDLKNGAKPDAIKTQTLTLESARVSLESVQADLSNTLIESYVKADDAVRNKVGQFFNEYYAATQQLGVGNGGSQAKIDLLNRRSTIEQLLTNWKASLDMLNTQSDLFSYAGAAKSYLLQIEGFLDSAALIINNISPDPNISQTTLRNWRSDIFTARINVIGELKTIAAGEGKVKDAKIKVKLQESQLATQKESPSDAQIKIQEGLLNQTTAQAAIIQAEIDKSTLVTPIDGIIKRQAAKVGLMVNRGAAILSLGE